MNISCPLLSHRAMISNGGASKCDITLTYFRGNSADKIFESRGLPSTLSWIYFPSIELVVPSFASSIGLLMASVRTDSTELCA